MSQWIYIDTCCKYSQKSSSWTHCHVRLQDFNIPVMIIIDWVIHTSVLSLHNGYTLLEINGESTVCMSGAIGGVELHWEISVASDVPQCVVTQSKMFLDESLYSDTNTYQGEHTRSKQWYILFTAQCLYTKHIKPVATSCVQLYFNKALCLRVLISGSLEE